MANLFPLRLVGSRMIAPTVRHLDFVRDDGQPLDFVPGQFIQVHFNYPDGTATKRSYSLATMHDHALGPGESVQIAVSYVPGGAATALFTALDEGQQIQASGPYGRFCLMPADSNRRYLLIGTGTGVTPYRAMLPQLAPAMAQRDLDVVLLFGAHAGRTDLRRGLRRVRRRPPTLPLRALLQPRAAGGGARRGPSGLRPGRPGRPGAGSGP